jgi:hypothetical protein
VSLPAGFVIQELVTPEIFKQRGASAIELIDPRILQILGQLRADYGPLIVNNWHTGGAFKFRGYRPKDCPVGAPGSMHKRGMAVDCHSPKIATEQLRREVIAKAKTNHPVYSLIGAIEDGVNWLHVDVRPRVGGALKVFRP